MITRAIQEEAPLWGPTDETGPVVTSTPTQTTPQMPSIPFGDIPEGFQGIRLPGALLDTGRGFAEEIGGELGRRKAMEKGGNLPFIGGIILDYGEKKGQEQGRETFDKYNLISALHSFMLIEDKKYKNLLPPLILLSSEKQKELLSKLETCPN